MTTPALAAMDADLVECFHEMGESATFRPGPGETEIRVLVTAPFRAAEAFDADDAALYLRARAVDVPGLVHGDRFTVRGAEYQVVGIESDGQTPSTQRIHLGEV